MCLSCGIQRGAQPTEHPELTNMVIFRENTEDIYAGAQWAAGSEGVKKVIEFPTKEMGVRNPLP